MLQKRCGLFLLFYLSYGFFVVVFPFNSIYEIVPGAALPASPLNTFHRQSQLSCVHKCVRRKEKCVFKRYSADKKEGDCILYNVDEVHQSGDSGIVSLQPLKFSACKNLPCKFGVCFDNTASSKGFYCQCWKYVKGEACDNFYGGSSAAYSMESCSSLYNIDPSLKNGFYWITHNGSPMQIYCDKSTKYGELSSKEGRELTRNELITTIPKFPKAYSISFSVKFTEKLLNEQFYSIIHFTLGNDKSKNGDRTPGVWMTNYGKLYISTTLNDDMIAVLEIRFPADTNVWTDLVIQQLKENDNFWFKVFINESSVIAEQNNNPYEFNNIKLFAADKWYQTQPGIIRNLFIKTY